MVFYKVVYRQACVSRGRCTSSYRIAFVLIQIIQTLSKILSSFMTRHWRGKFVSFKMNFGPYHFMVGVKGYPQISED